MLQCRRHTHDSGQVLGAGALAALLCAAVNEAAEHHAPLGIQHADALGAMELVGGKGEHINFLLSHVHLDVTHSLDGIGVEQNALFPAHSANFRNGLNRADFIVGEHYSHQAGVIPNGIPHLLSSDDAVFVYIQQGDFKALRSELVQGVQHGVMLKGGGASFPFLHPGQQRRRWPGYRPRCRRR